MLPRGKLTWEAPLYASMMMIILINLEMVDLQ
jgi:hypothetical protein